MPQLLRKPFHNLFRRVTSLDHELNDKVIGIRTLCLGVEARLPATRLRVHGHLKNNIAPEL